MGTKPTKSLSNKTNRSRKKVKRPQNADEMFERWQHIPPFEFAEFRDQMWETLGEQNKSN